MTWQRFRIQFHDNLSNAEIDEQFNAILRAINKVTERVAWDDTIESG